jgi:Circadian oscillating protein COP23
MNNSVTLLSLSLALVLSANAAWGESKIERESRTSGTQTAQQSRPGAPQTNSQRTTVTGDGNSTTRTQTNSQSGSSSTNTQVNGQTVVTNSSARFACENVNGQLTVIYRPQSRQNEAYPWAVPGDMGSAWNAQRRCGEIARRLESYRPDGLQELRTGIQNQQNVVCVTTEKDQSCRIVFTVPSQQDPTSTRDRVFRNLTLADSGQQTAGVNTFAGTGGDFIGGLFGGSGNSNSNPRPNRSVGDGLDLRPYLSTQDGGTGNRIGNPVPVPTQYRLNPDNFR